MATRGKKYQEMREKVDPEKKHELAAGVALAKATSYSSFPGSLELHLKTNANPKFNDQMLRGTVVLPHGTGKSVTVAAFVDEEHRDEAEKAGADIIGTEEIIQQVEEGNINFDIIVTTSELMRELAKVARVLGPQGLMPSPKAGTVTNDIAGTIDEIKKGRVEYKLDKTGNLHVAVGKIDFDDKQLIENIEALLTSLRENKPSGVSGKLIKKMVVSATMGPGVQIIPPSF